MEKTTLFIRLVREVVFLLFLIAKISWWIAYVVIPALNYPKVNEKLFFGNSAWR